MYWFGRLLILSVIFLLLPQLVYAQGTTLVVNSPNDPGDGTCTVSHCTLREAITAANASGGIDTIRFNLPGAGPYVIRPITPLPAITGPVIIDGTTQPGYPGAPIVELDGSLAGYPADGLRILNGGSTVRGLLIHSFGGAGIRLDGGAGSTIAGNYIGTDITGAIRRGNRDGIYLFNSSNNTIGGPAAADRNLISGNNDDGINLDWAAGNSIQGNTIGLSRTGQPLGNAGNGIRFHAESGNNTIALNTIAANGWHGILVEGGAPAPAGIRITQNRIHNNGALGIDLGDNGVTANDAGPNGHQNYPLLASASSNGSALVINGTLNSAPGSQYRIEFFQSAQCDASGSGEGQVYAGSADVVTAADGTAAFNVTLSTSVPAGAAVTATATDAAGSTSEFSACLPAGSFAPPPSAPNSVPQRNSFYTGRPTLTWGYLTWAVAFQLQIDDDSRFRSPQINVDLPGNVLEFTPDEAQALGDGTYYWRVRAKNTSNTWGGWSAADVIVIDVP